MICKNKKVDFYTWAFYLFPPVYIFIGAVISFMSFNYFVSQSNEYQDAIFHQWQKRIWKKWAYSKLDLSFLYFIILFTQFFSPFEW